MYVATNSPFATFAPYLFILFNRVNHASWHQHDNNAIFTVFNQAQNPLVNFGQFLWICQKRIIIVRGQNFASGGHIFTGGQNLASRGQNSASGGQIFVSGGQNFATGGQNFVTGGQIFASLGPNSKF